MGTEAEIGRGEVEVVDTAIVATLLARLRDRATGVADFRQAAHQLGAQLASHVAGHLPRRETMVTSPLGEAPAVQITPPAVAVVLRAGLGLLPGVLDVFPSAPVGMIGLARDERTLLATQYYRNLPDLQGRDLLVLEPMLATGGSASNALALLPGARRRILVGVVASPTAIERIHRDHPKVDIVVAAVDPELDDNGWIVPGLGDFGDRLWGT